MIQAISTIKRILVLSVIVLCISFVQVFQILCSKLGLLNIATLVLIGLVLGCKLE